MTDGPLTAGPGPGMKAGEAGGPVGRAASRRRSGARRVGGLVIRPLAGEAIRPHLGELASVYLTVFRKFPYLDAGSEQYERRYLEVYAEVASAVVICAFHGDRIVGAATALPMPHAAETMWRPLAAAGYDPAEVFYFGESVLLPEYRGSGVGVAFFRDREAHARAVGGYRHACFAAVIRPKDHPRRPPDYQPLDRFWRRRGFRRLRGVIGHMSWRDLDETVESEKPMQFWMKDLDS